MLFFCKTASNNYNNNLYLYNQENGDLVVGTNASQRLRITNTGQVNIGGDYSQTSKTYPKNKDKKLKKIPLHII